jgi:hypothetical protein
MMASLRILPLTSIEAKRPALPTLQIGSTRDVWAMMPTRIPPNMIYNTAFSRPWLVSIRHERHEVLMLKAIPELQAAAPVFATIRGFRGPPVWNSRHRLGAISEVLDLFADLQNGVGERSSAFCLYPPVNRRYVHR